MLAKDHWTEKAAKQNIMFDQVDAGQGVCYLLRELSR
jgi:hypothetical protein